MIDGKIKIYNPQTGKTYQQKMRSFNNFLLGFFALSFGFGGDNISYSFDYDSHASIIITGASNSTQGIRINNSSAPLQCSQYSLQGNFSDFYPGTQEILDTDCNISRTSEEQSFSFSRYIKNASSASVTVKEVGIYGKQSCGTVSTTTKYPMFVRDLLETQQELGQNEGLNISYSFTISGGFNSNFARIFLSSMGVGNEINSASKVLTAPPVGCPASGYPGKYYETCGKYRFTHYGTYGHWYITKNNTSVGIIIGRFGASANQIFKWDERGKWPAGHIYDNVKTFDNELYSFTASERATTLIVSRTFKNDSYYDDMEIRSLGLSIPGYPDWGGVRPCMVFLRQFDAITVKHEEIITFKVKMRTEM